MRLEEVAKAMKELGHPTRLKIYKQVVKAGYEGLPVGELQRSLDIPGSTLTHHIASLMSVGLIEQVRHGRTLNCVSHFETLESIILFLQDECCLK